ncbi:BLUF domain-containing protein [Aureimonas mangrovi]|uniref:BLUF domain-containing protein n=1 Tax=Aureimonas mangrovi TaxID=2758041 RepID=UPI00163DAB56|nr:BLUF domain-containing protein [Aureimonas mangrovi]
MSALLLIRLTYSSSLRPTVTPDEIDEIVRRSDVSNRQLGISGMLALDGGRVCQILEGAEAGVQSLYRRIERDKRHEGVVVIDQRPIKSRAFASWGMTRRSMADAAMVALAAD